ncbi:MAG: leucine-rich repeat protein [Treponema sp.]|jgi:hypothetical protein|nr:leucine-rich repeat protein [Treponema sp.]
MILKESLRRLTLTALLFAACCAYGQQKFALVMGNAAYTVGALRNTLNDANDMKAALENLGFTVDLVRNGDLPSMIDAVMRLSERLRRSPDAYGLFYYSGHGAQTDGENYLIPVNADIKTKARLRYDALHLQYVLDELQDANNALNIVVLDACRDNPFAGTKSDPKGLGVVGRQPPGSIIVYATSANSVASDGEGRNGTFTAELLRQLRIPGLEVKDMFNRVAFGVQRASGNTQIPAIYLQFFDAAYLGSAPIQPPQPPPAPSDWTPASDFDLGLVGEKGVTIKKYKGKAQRVNIPAVIDGSPVVEIGSSAFDGCGWLTSISIPAGVTAIGAWAFDGCSGLTSITVDALNTRYSAANGVLFSKDKKTLVRYPAGKTYTSYTIPAGVTAIGDWAFSGCSRLTSISIPAGLTAIGSSAFSGCSGLTSISIPAGVTAIGDLAFSGCGGLTSISIPAGVTSIGYGAFYGCSGLTSISIPAGVTSIGDDAFYSCSKLSAESREAIRKRFGDKVF